MIYVYITTWEPGPRSVGEPRARYVETSEYPLFVQERNAIGDTLFRQLVGIAETKTEADALVNEAEESLLEELRKWGPW